MKKRIISFLLSIMIIISAVPSFAFTASAATAYENELKSKGFNDSYISALVQLHNKYPNWKFEPLKTGLNWNDVINGERSYHSKQLIELQNSLNSGYYCQCSSCFKNGSYVLREAGVMVAASEAAVKYYVDPRNWLDEKHIFQFESNEYNPAHTKAGVEAILKGTWMYNSLITYVDTEGRTKQFDSKTKYSDAILQAAQKSGLSAYYLAAKIRQENGGATANAYAVRGTISPFQGIYNYYNIGANAGAKDGLAWAAGYLKLLNDSTMYSSFDAKTNTLTGSTTSLKKGQYMTWIDIYGDSNQYYKVRLYVENGPNSYTEGKIGYVKRSDVRTDYIGYTTSGYGRPWREPYTSIIKGAEWINNNFKGQFTGYLQKFNVNPNASSSLYNHEYMANVQGAASEAVNTYNGYNNAGVLSNSMVFYIPIFNNMPASKSPAPTPNTPQVSGLTLSSSTTNSLSIKWNSVLHATSYYIDVTNKSTGERFHKTTPNTSYTLTSLNPNTQYSITIEAYADSKWGPASTALICTTKSNSTSVVNTPQVTGLTLTSATTNTLNLKWNAVANATSYYIDVTNKSTGERFHKTTPNNSYSLTSLTANTQYSITIEAYANSKWGPASTALLCTTQANAPAVSTPKVTGLALTGRSPQTLYLKWNAVANATSYYIDVKNNSTGEKFHKTTPNSTYALSDLKPCNSYTITIEAYANKKWGPASDSITYRTRPNVVTGAKISAQDTSSVTISWNRVYPGQGYKVYRYNTDGSTVLLKTIDNGSTTSYKVTGLSSGYGQLFKVCAYFDGVDSGLTDIIMGATTPAKVSGVTLTTNTNHNIGVKWDKVPGICAGYQVEFSRSYNFSTSIAVKTVSGQSSLSYTGSGFTSGVWYYIRVRAYRSVNGKTYYGPWSDKAYINSK